MSAMASQLNHPHHDCLLNRLFRRRSKKTSKIRVTGLCEGNSPVTGEFPAQMASNAENVFIWWRHHVPVMSWKYGKAEYICLGYLLPFRTGPGTYFINEFPIVIRFALTKILMKWPHQSIAHGTITVTLPWRVLKCSEMAVTERNYTKFFIGSRSTVNTVNVTWATGETYDLQNIWGSLLSGMR